MPPNRREQAPPVDPDVKVPRAIREAAERASAAQSASIGQAEPPVIAAPPADPDPAIAGAPPAPAAGSLPPRSASPPQEPPPEPDDLETRYKRLHGRYESDRKRARETIEQMAERINTLERQATVAAPAVPTPPPKLNISPQEVEDYGEDFISMVQRIAQHTVEGRIAPLRDEVGRTQQQVRVQENLTMHDQMNRLFPQWQELNQDQRFIEWVLLPDPYSGAIRQRLMQEAWNAGDARRVLAFFQGFLSEEAALNPQGQGNGRAALAPIAPNGASASTPPLSLAALAAPGGARSASPAPADKPVYSTEDITRFYTEVAAGRWRHREPERAAIDADIMRAQHEGRILLNNRRFTPPAAPSGMTR